MTKPFDQLKTVLADLDAECVALKAKDAPRFLKKLFKQEAMGTVALTNEAIVKKYTKRKDIGPTPKFIRLPKKAADGEETVLWRDTLAQADAGVTGAFGVAAETGSALLNSSEPDARLVSLLPPHHILLVEEKHIQATVQELFSRWQEKGDIHRNAVFVSGPSRTADIEKELVLGVHGPGKLTMLVIKE